MHVHSSNERKSGVVVKNTDSEHARNLNLMESDSDRIEVQSVF